MGSCSVVSQHAMAGLRVSPIPLRQLAPTNNTAHREVLQRLPCVFSQMLVSHSQGPLVIEGVPEVPDLASRTENGKQHSFLLLAVIAQLLRTLCVASQ
jgi:hypothetical protein